MIRALLCIVVLASACGGKAKTPPPEPVANKQPVAETPPPPAPAQHSALVAMADFEKKMCACTEKTCAQRVSDEMTAWAQAEAAKSSEPVKMSEDDVKRATDIGMHMGECMQKAMTPPGTP